MTTQPLITSDHPKGRQATDLFRAVYNRAELDEERAQALNERGGDFQTYIMAGIKRFTAKAPNYDLARTILGKDFISPEEIATARGLTYTDEQLAKFGDTLPTQEALEWCRDNGTMLVAGPPKSMSLLDIRSLKAGYFYSKQGGWYSESAQKFARADKVEPIWIALSKEPVAGSLSSNWSEQSNLVVEPMVVPNAAEAVWGLTTYKAVRGKYLLPNLYVRTSSCDSGGDRVNVGHFDSEGLNVNDFWDSNRSGSLGVSVARKF